MVLTKIEARLVAKLLRLAADSFSNHTCTDFNLLENGVSSKMAKEINLDVLVHGGDDDAALELEAEDDLARFTYIDDWCLMYYLADRLDGHSSRDTAEEKWQQG